LHHKHGFPDAQAPLLSQRERRGWESEGGKDGLLCFSPSPLPLSLRERGKQALTAEVSAQPAWMFSQLRKSCQLRSKTVAPLERSMLHPLWQRCIREPPRPPKPAENLCAFVPLGAFVFFLGSLGVPSAPAPLLRQTAARRHHGHHFSVQRLGLRLHLAHRSQQFGGFAFRQAGGVDADVQRRALDRSAR